MNHVSVLENRSVIIVWFLQAVAWILTITDVKELFALTSFAVATGYTVYKWIREIRKNKKKLNGTERP